MILGSTETVRACRRIEPERLINAVEMNESVSLLAERRFDLEEIAFAFREARGDGMTAVRWLRTGTTSRSDIRRVLQPNNIRIHIAADRKAGARLVTQNVGPETVRASARFVFAPDGREIHDDGPGVACQT